ncbi:MAG: tRNA dihydrouridine synthase DusB [Pseudomonadota bacterium]
MIRLGDHIIETPLALAPMAGVTDRPFRQLCRKLGAGWTPSEMVTSQASLRNSRKTRLRMDHRGEPGPIIVQIAGSDPAQLAEAAQFNVENGADVIDINMGCPAKKVCNVAAGSALLSDEPLVASILRAVVDAVDVPVTLKTRTGPTAEERNAVRIARLAEDSGIQMLSLHGRTRDQLYKGEAEYRTIAEVRRHIHIPLVANGDIDSPERARRVLDETGADALMIGRAAQGNPWIFREVDHYLRTGRKLPAPGADEIRETLLGHLEALYEFYGEYMGLRIARKHIAWYLKPRSDFKRHKKTLFAIDSAGAQYRAIDTILSGGLRPPESDNTEELAA